MLPEFIKKEYNFDVLSIVPAKRGYFGETWKLTTADQSYFLKLVSSVSHKPRYENSFHIIQQINNQGIDFVSKIVKTVHGELYTHFDSAVLGVFEWIDGENIQNEHTKIYEYKMLGKIYTVLPAGLNIPREDFSGKSADVFFAQCERLDNKELLSLFYNQREKIQHRAERLKLFANRCKSDLSKFFITHGDAGGNVLVKDKKFYLVDWDDPILAPPERDAWFCMHWDWAMDAFHKAMRHNGIFYTLRPERLAYYCYHMFFFYLNEFLKTYFESGEILISDYFTCWIEDNLKFADSIV